VEVMALGRRQIQEVRSGGSYLSQSDLRVHFGVGLATKIDLIEVHWPSGLSDKVENVSTNQYLILEEGRGLVQ